MDLLVNRIMNSMTAQRANTFEIKFVYLRYSDQMDILKELMNGFIIVNKVDK